MLFRGYLMSESRLIRTSLGTLLVVAAFGSAGLVSSRLPAASSVEVETLAKQFCVLLPEAAHVLATDPIDHSFGVAVPPVPGLPGGSSSAALRVAKGDVIRFVIVSPRPGAIGVHGLSDILPIRAGETVQISLRAIYPGRFPVHFHGVDGSHFEVSAFEVS